VRSPLTKAAADATAAQVLDAIAAQPYLSALRLADELALPARDVGACIADLEDAGLVRRDEDELAWVLTDAGRQHRRARARGGRRLAGRLRGALRL
jgi:DNA-binding IclR family transcriptional regulator